MYYNIWIEECWVIAREKSSTINICGYRYQSTLSTKQSHFNLFIISLDNQIFRNKYLFRTIYKDIWMKLYTKLVSQLFWEQDCVRERFERKLFSSKFKWGVTSLIHVNRVPFKTKRRSGWGYNLSAITRSWTSVGS